MVRSFTFLALLYPRGSFGLGCAALDWEFHPETATISMLHVTDWIVITLYGVGMIAVGWYYARRTATADDFVLGGHGAESGSFTWQLDPAAVPGAKRR